MLSRVRRPGPPGWDEGVRVPFLVEVEREFTAVQGLPSPVRAGLARPVIPTGERVRMVLRVGIAFADDQLTDRGWFFDTDAVGEIVDHWRDRLAARPWTQQFPFRATFELVSRHVFEQLAASVPQVAYVDLQDRTFGSRTRYTPPAGGRSVPG